MLLYQLRVETADGETLERSISCESAEDAVRLMKAKFRDSRNISVIGSREKSAEESEEEERIRRNKTDLEYERLEVSALRSKKSGFWLMVCGTLAFFMFLAFGYIVYICFGLALLGSYLHSRGKSSLRRLKWQKEEDH